jgi:GDP-fucose transporter C1
MFNKEEKHSFDQAYEQRDNPTEFVSKRHSSNLIALVVLFYFTISLSVVFLNKFILSSAKYEFPYPLFITWYQLMVALVLLFALSELGKS